VIIGGVTGNAGTRGTSSQLGGSQANVGIGNRRRQAAGVSITRNPVQPGPRVVARGSRPTLKLRKPLRITTWNVRTIRAIGKVQVVEKEMQRLKVGCLGLSETRWTGRGQFVTDSGSTVVYSGSANAAGGVAVILNKQWGDSVLRYNPVSDRIMTVRVQASPWNLTLIQVYAPTNQATELEKDTFYQGLEDTYERYPKQAIVLVSGDFNAKIGERAPIGKYAMGVRNDNGDRLIQFAQANGLCAANSWVMRHPRRLSTWRSPDGGYRNQIDYFLVPQR